MAKKSEKKRKSKFVRSFFVFTSAGTLLSSTALAGIPSKSIKNITTTPRADQITLQMDNSESKPILLATKKKVAKKIVAKKKVAKKKTAKKRTAARKKITARRK